MSYACNLKNSISEVGKWITENAEEIATHIEAQTGTTIRIDFDMNEIAPQITVEKYFISKKATEKLYEKQMG